MSQITSQQTQVNDRAPREEEFVRTVAKRIESIVSGANRARYIHEAGHSVVNVNNETVKVKATAASGSEEGIDWRGQDIGGGVGG